MAVARYARRITPLFPLALHVLEPRLALTGDVRHPRSLASDEMRPLLADEVRDMEVAEKGVAGQAKAFPLISLLRIAGPRLDP